MPSNSITQEAPEALLSRVNSIGSLRIEFGSEIPPTAKPRIDYAFRVFAAIFGYRVLEKSESAPDAIVLYYGRSSPTKAAGRSIQIPARYRPFDSQNPSRRLLKHEYANETLRLFFGLDATTKKPDWLGEIFEWISSSHEQGITDRDSIGRIPFASTILAQDELSPRKPYAMLLMSWLQNELTNRGKIESLPKAPSPVSGVDHFVISSHDIDFYYTSKRSALARLLKNLIIAIRPFKDASFFAWNFRQILPTLAGRRICDYLPPLLHTARERGFSSTIFVVAKKGHRRDPNYSIHDLSQQLRSCAGKGFSLALHGSYESIVGKTGLADEVIAMSSALLIRPLGGRQHWLRFSEHQSLFDEVQRAGFRYDSTLGFAETAGFRNGACFAFPPYDFADEKPYPFLEIPLALMDGSIEAAARSSGEEPAAIAHEVLIASRKLGWGGISADWHNPLESIQVPPRINQIFWDCVSAQRQNREKWISADEFLSLTLSRYQNAGLLRDIPAAPELSNGVR